MLLALLALFAVLIDGAFCAYMDLVKHVTNTTFYWFNGAICMFPTILIIGRRR